MLRGNLISVGAFYLWLVIVPVLLNACNWCYLRTLEASHMRCQRQILGIRYIDHIRSATLSLHTGLASVGEQIASRCVAIFGHIARLGEEVPAHDLSMTSAHVDLSLGCLPGRDWIVLVNQTTDGSIRFVSTPASCSWCYGDQPFFVAVAQEWRNGPRLLRERDDDNDDDATCWVIIAKSFHHCCPPALAVSVILCVMGFSWLLLGFYGVTLC